MMIVGTGNGLTIPSVVGAVLSSGIPADRAGMAAGVLTTSQQFGNAIGATVLGVVFFSALGSGGAGGYVTAMEMAALGGAVVLAIVLSAALALPRQRS
jgi:hypothetical protein